MNTRDLKWRKASFSDPNGQCVELADLSEWRKASFSVNEGNCVELAESESVVAMRDSKLGDDSPILELSRSELKAFVQGIKAGEFNDFA